MIFVLIAQSVSNHIGVAAAHLALMNAAQLAVGKMLTIAVIDRAEVCRLFRQMLSAIVILSCLFFIAAFFLTGMLGTVFSKPKTCIATGRMSATMGIAIRIIVVATMVAGLIRIFACSSVFCLC